jgi:hypothetical protein
MLFTDYYLFIHRIQSEIIIWKPDWYIKWLGAVDIGLRLKIQSLVPPPPPFCGTGRAVPDLI